MEVSVVAEAAEVIAGEVTVEEAEEVPEAEAVARRVTRRSGPLSPSLAAW